MGSVKFQATKIRTFFAAFLSNCVHMFLVWTFFVGSYYRDRRVERQSRWPEALFRRLATLCPTRNPSNKKSVQSEICPTRNPSNQETPRTDIRDAKWFIYFECLSTLLSLYTYGTDLFSIYLVDQVIEKTTVLDGGGVVQRRLDGHTLVVHNYSSNHALNINLDQSFLIKYN